MYNIAVLEFYPLHKDIPEINIWSMHMHPVKPTTKKYEIEHGYYVILYRLYWYKKYFTKEEIKNCFKILYMKKKKSALQHCLKENAVSINVSSLCMDYDTGILENMYPVLKENAFKLEKKVASIIPMYAGAGNDGNEVEDHFEGILASREAVYGVGAVNTQHIPRGFSSWGNGAVDFCGIDGLIENKVGTSYATSASAIIDSYMIRHDMLFKFMPKREQCEQYRDLHCKDLLTPGEDLKTGKGVLVAPQKLNYFVTVFDYSQKERKKTVLTYEKGQLKEEETDKLIHFELNRTGLITIYHDRENKKIYYSHPVV